VPDDAPQPLHPLVGDMWLPAWAVRPGSYKALQEVADAMPLFLALHSRCGDLWLPCYASRDTLGATIGISPRTVDRKLQALGKVGLLLEVDRGRVPRTKRQRPKARWCLDPFKVEKWRPKVEERLQRMREEDGRDGRWLHNALTALEAFERRSKALRRRIEEDMPAGMVQRQRRNEQRRMKKKIKLQVKAGGQNCRGGEGFYQGGDEGDGKAVLRCYEDRLP
jgi:hypothetical protein